MDGERGEIGEQVGAGENPVGLAGAADPRQDGSAGGGALRRDELERVVADGEVGRGRGPTDVGIHRGQEPHALGGALERQVAGPGAAVEIRGGVYEMAADYYNHYLAEHEKDSAREYSTKYSFSEIKQDFQLFLLSSI